MKRTFCLITSLALATSAHAFIFGPKGDSAAEKKANIRKQRDEMLAQLYASNPNMKKVIKKSAGYATFTQVNVNLLLLATGNGYGVVVDLQARARKRSCAWVRWAAASARASRMCALSSCFTTRR